MGKIKSFLYGICSIMVVITLIISASIPAYAASVEGYGTPEDGIIPNALNYSFVHTPYPDDGFKNIDFHDGFMYYTTNSGKKVSEVATLGKDGEDNYIQFHDLEGLYDGFSSIRFSDSRIKPGDLLVTIYEWQNSVHNIQVYLHQTNGDLKTSRLTYYHHKHIVKAETPDQWNLTVSSNQYPVSETRDEVQPLIMLGIQTFQDPACTTKIKNIRIGKIDPKTNDVADLDGNFVCNLGPVVQATPEAPEETKDNTETAPQKEKEEEKTDSFVYVAVIAGGCALLAIIATVAVLIFATRKKK